MLAHYFNSYGKDLKGTIGKLPNPSMGPQDVLIQIHAASVNPVDFKIRYGKHRFVRKDSFPLHRNEKIVNKELKSNSGFFFLLKNPKLESRLGTPP